MSDRDAPARYQPRIRDLPSVERPRERLRDHGAAQLSPAELLAILLRTGSGGENVIALATRLLAEKNGLAGLAHTGFHELGQVHGMGEAKTAQIMAALELGKRVAALRPEERPTIRSPRDVANLLTAEMGLLTQESLRVLLLNTRNQVLATREIYRGNVSSAVLRTAEVLRGAVREGCPSIIVVHNHPSGDPTPSSDDVQVTAQIVKAGRLLDIDVLDHVVIAQGGFVSLKDRGLGFT